MNFASEEVLRGLLHEVRSPLATIIVLSNHLRSHKGGGKSAGESALLDIEYSARWLDETLSMAGFILRSGSSSPLTERRAFCMSSVVQKATREAELYFLHRNIVVRAEFGLAPVDADAHLVEMAVGALLRAGASVAKERSTITVSELARLSSSALRGFSMSFELPDALGVFYQHEGISQKMPFGWRLAAAFAEHVALAHGGHTFQRCDQHSVNIDLVLPVGALPTPVESLEQEFPLIDGHLMC